MFSLQSNKKFYSIGLWGVFIASFLMTLIVGGTSGIKESIGGLLLQFIGTIYWGNRVQKKPSLFLRFWVTNESPGWEKLCFGGIAFVALFAGQLYVFLELLH